MASSTVTLSRPARSAFRALTIGAVVLATGACDPDPRFDPGCPSGTINCPCLPDGTCEENEGECIDDLCLDTDIEEPIPPQKVEDISDELRPPTEPSSSDPSTGGAGGLRL